jgi:menaquinone-dependent protoporphyrinogen oxidase
MPEESRRAFLVDCGSALVALAACGSSGIACAGPKPRASSVHFEGDPAAVRRALVLYGTRAGSTAEVADFIGKKLSERNWYVDVEGVEGAKDLGSYQAVVIGSAIRKGSVLPEVRKFVRARRAELRMVPVAYFAVCMTLREDSPANRAKASTYLDPLRSEVTPVRVGLFAGKMDYTKLDAGSKLIANVVRIPAGDFRDWKAIEAWTVERNIS